MDGMTAEEMKNILERLLETFDDTKIVTEDGSEVSHINYQRHPDRYRDGNVFIIQTEDN